MSRTPTSRDESRNGKIPYRPTPYPVYADGISFSHKNLKIGRNPGKPDKIQNEIGGRDFLIEFTDSVFFLSGSSHFLCPEIPDYRFLCPKFPFSLPGNSRILGFGCRAAYKLPDPRELTGIHLQKRAHATPASASVLGDSVECRSS